MNIDLPTPQPFDQLLLVLTIPVLIACSLFLVHRTLAYRQYQDRRSLAGWMTALAFMVVAIQYLVRPISDIWDAWGQVERLTAPMARIVVFCTTLTLWWYDVKEKK
jgi:hypothetical protein